MKITRKMSPMLLALVAVLIGCSMMASALSVIVSQGPASSVATVTVADAITLSKADATTNGLGLWSQEMPYLGDATTPAVGATYDVQITARSSAALPNVVFYFKITKTDVDGTTPVLIQPSDVIVKEYQQNISTSHWNLLDLESYGDYLLGSFLIDESVETTYQSVSVSDGWSDVYVFLVQFANTGVYTFDWYAASPSSPTAAT